MSLTSHSSALKSEFALIGYSDNEMRLSLGELYQSLLKKSGVLISNLD